MYVLAANSTQSLAQFKTTAFPVTPKSLVAATMGELTAGMNVNRQQPTNHLCEAEINDIGQ